MTTTSEPSAAISDPDPRPRRPVTRWAGDALALLLLASVLVYLEPHDGGLSLAALRWAAAVALIALPVLVAELRHLPRAVVWLLAAWVAGTILSVAFAEIRSDILRPAMVHGVVPAVFLAALRIRRRPWWPLAVAGFLAVTLGVYWERSFLAWWGYTLDARQPVWTTLSWRNPSGMLMGALGLGLLGPALTTRGVWRWGAALLSAMAFAGTVLSSSRGALLVTVVGALLVVSGAAWTLGARRRVAVSALVVVAATVGTTQALLAMDQRDEATTPLASREQTVEQNSRARLYHAEAALGMFLDRPLTGQGLGSYRITAVPFTSPAANLTSSAHNEYVETLGEGGVVLGGSFLLLHAFAAAVALATLRRGGDGSELERGLALGAAGVVLALAAHAAMDFDWGYAVLPSLLAISAAVTFGDRRHAQAAPTAIAVTGVGTAMLLGVTLLVVSHSLAQPATTTGLTAEGYAASASPLDLDQLVGVGYRLWEDGHPELAGSVAERGLVWHPGSSRLATLRALTRYDAGQLTPGELARSVGPPYSRFDEYRYVALALTHDGHLDLADEVLTREQELLAAHRSWGVGPLAQAAWLARIALSDAEGGCAAARAASEEALADPVAGLPDDLPVERLLADAGTDC